MPPKCPERSIPRTNASDDNGAHCVDEAPEKVWEEVVHSSFGTEDNVSVCPRIKDDFVDGRVRTAGRRIYKVSTKPENSLAYSAMNQLK